MIGAVVLFHSVIFLALITPSPNSFKKEKTSGSKNFTGRCKFASGRRVRNTGLTKLSDFN
jgi:hypothetical protein